MILLKVMIEVKLRWLSRGILFLFTSREEPPLHVVLSIVVVMLKMELKRSALTQQRVTPNIAPQVV